VHDQSTPENSGNQLATHTTDAELRWGPWVFNRKSLCIVFNPRFEAEAGGDVAYRGRGYEIDLRECRDSHQILVWVAQLHGKGWITPIVVGYLMRAFDDLVTLRYLESALSDAEIGARVEAGLRYRRVWSSFKQDGETISISELIRRTPQAAGAVQ
jgi:hypothetical protein